MSVFSRIRKAARARTKALPRILNKVHPPGMRGAGLYDVLDFFWISLQNPRFNLAAMAMSYRFFFAVFPTMILIFTLIPFIPIPHLKEELLLFLGTIVPQDSLGFIYHVVNEFFQKPSAGVISLNIALLMYSATSGISVMMQAFAKDHPGFKKRNFFHGTAVAFAIAMLLFVLLLMMLFLHVGSEFFIKSLVENGHVPKDGIWVFIFRCLNYVLLFFSLQIAVSVIYYFGPFMDKRWKFFSPGSITAGLLVLLANVAFQFFFVNFTDYNKVYGSLGAIMLMMVWFYWLSIMLLIGFELNAAIDRALTEGHDIVVQATEETAVAKGEL